MAMSNTKNELRINALLNKIAKRNAGFAIFVAGICQWSGELKIVQTTRNANVSKLQDKHDFVVLEKLVSDEDLGTHLKALKAEFKSKRIVAQAAERSKPISERKLFVQFCEQGIPASKVRRIMGI